MFFKKKRDRFWIVQYSCFHSRMNFEWKCHCVLQKFMLEKNELKCLWYFVHLKVIACGKLWGLVSASGLLIRPEWRKEYPTSGQGSSEKRSPVVSRFSELLFLDVPGTATEQVRTCGFRRNSSSLDKAPKIRDSVLLNSFESFLVTLPSISSETWEL